MRDEQHEAAVSEYLESIILRGPRRRAGGLNCTHERVALIFAALLLAAALITAGALGIYLTHQTQAEVCPVGPPSHCIHAREAGEGR